MSMIKEKIKRFIIASIDEIVTTRDKAIQELNNKTEVLENEINELKSLQSKQNNEVLSSIDNVMNSMGQLQDIVETMKNRLDSYAENLKNNNLEMESNRKQLADFSENIRNNNKEMEDNRERLQNYSVNLANNNKEMEENRERLQNYSVNLANNNKEMQDIRQRLQDYSENLCNNNKEMDAMRQKFSDYSINLANNNTEMSNFREQYSEINSRMVEYEKTLAKDHVFIQNLVEHSEEYVENLQAAGQEEKIADSCIAKKEKIQYIPDKGSDYTSIDYFDFENHFRGSQKSIREKQEIYIPYFKDKKNVLDLGCGRGEFLELLQEYGIQAKGVELYDDYVNYCMLHELNVVKQDAVEYLDSIQSTDGIFAGQVIEHMKIDEIIRLCKLAYEKLETGSYMILETPNPTCLATFTNAFYIDPSHNKPVHPLTIQYIVEKAGFQQVEILYTDKSRSPIVIPKIESKDIANLDEFNQAMQKVSNMLFGSQDYAVIARK